LVFLLFSFGFLLSNPISGDDDYWLERAPDFEVYEKAPRLLDCLGAVYLLES
jgi:hypothetical protein